MSTLAASSPPPDADRIENTMSTAADVADVLVYETMSAALSPWAVLERLSPASPYQTRAWLLPWLRTLGSATGVTPALTVAFDRAGHPIALLPFGIMRTLGGRTAVFLGGKESNLNLGLFDPDLTWNFNTVGALLRETAARAQVDLFMLRNQPHEWAGRPNPFAALPHQISPSAAYKTTLSADWASYLASRFSNHARKLLRHRESRLRAIGVVEHRRAETRIAAREILDSYFAQKIERFRQSGLRMKEPEALRAFLDEASDPSQSTRPAVELHALACNERIIAVFGGTEHGGRFSGMFTSFDAEPMFARQSPGDVLLTKVMAQKCREGTQTFDLGIGEARYKDKFCPDQEALFDNFIGITVRGRIAASTLAGLARSKGALKQSRWAWSIIRKLRRLVARA